MTPVLSASIVLAVALVLGILVPVFAVRLFVPTLRTSVRAQAENYRGGTVFLGLGTAWLVWAGCAIVGGAVISSVLRGETVLVIMTIAGEIALVAFALGMLDDVYGSSDARGFRGHLRALRRGRVTTGLLKLVGIGLASLVVSFVLAGIAPWGIAATGSRWTATTVLIALVAGAAIALTSNFVNLLDLRPGRALKSYLLLGVTGALSAVALIGRLAGVPVPADVVLLDLIALVAFVAGPVVAVWRYDLGEQGMLGDAGANAMGAVAGLLVVSGLALPALLAYAALVLALNLVSERVSFSAVIDQTPALRWLDSLGRLSEDSANDVTAAPDEARYDATDDHDTREA